MSEGERTMDDGRYTMDGRRQRGEKIKNQNAKIKIAVLYCSAGKRILRNLHIVLSTNQKDYEHFIRRIVFK